MPTLYGTARSGNRLHGISDRQQSPGVSSNVISLAPYTLSKNPVAMAIAGDKATRA